MLGGMRRFLVRFSLACVVGYALNLADPLAMARKIGESAKIFSAVAAINFKPVSKPRKRAWAADPRLDRQSLAVFDELLAGVLA